MRVRAHKAIELRPPFRRHMNGDRRSGVPARVSDDDGRHGNPVGYYVHHHGRGHASRFRRISDAWTFENELVALSESDVGGIELVPDVPECPLDPTAGGVFHWAPVGDPTLAHRAAQIVGWLCARTPRGCVVDVSVEAALLCRLAGVATVVVRQHGDRTDVAHDLAYRSARRLLAPFPQELEHRMTPDWVVDKTDYSGFIGAGDAPSCRPPPFVVDSDDVIVLWGAGGGELSDDSLKALCCAVWPNRVICAGNIGAARSVGQSGSGSNLVRLGWLDRIGPLLTSRPTIVSSAGNNTVADAATAGCALVVVPQARPFDEQHRHAESLADAGVAAVAHATMSITAWRSALDVARGRRAALVALAAPDGARAAVDAIGAAFEMTMPG